MSVLARILEQKRAEVERLARDPGASALRREARRAPPVRDFAGSLRHGPPPRVIAEFKRASPSKGLICADADPRELARAYAGAGATALSVLTDREFFQGSLADLRRARDACALPVLRKDFVIDSLQLAEARGAGADAVLLIVAALDDARLEELLDETRAYGMDALVEVHTRSELDRARAAGAKLLGINNRDLNSFRTDLAVTRQLLPHAGGCTVVSESGFGDAETLAGLASAGVHAFLIGEALMSARRPDESLRRLRGEV